MNTIDSLPLPDIMTPEKVLSHKEKPITICGYVYKIRRASGIVFVSLSHDRYIYQSVYIPEICDNSLNEICEGSYIELTADIKEEKRAEHGFELTMRSFKILSKPTEEYPICITQPTLTCNLTENLNNRTIALRHPRESAIMNIVSGIKSAFNHTMEGMSFSLISTPKISTIKDSSTDYITAKYFGNQLNLVLSPHYYKQLSLCTFSRVYEIANCFSDINRNSTRHLNEFTCLEFEMAYTGGIENSMRTITTLIKDSITYVSNKYKNELKLLNSSLPEIKSIPCITFDEATQILSKEASCDIDPTDEAKLTAYAKEQFGCEFIFVTNLPSLKQPFYVRERENFILIYKGVTIASGSENINDYNELIETISQKGLNPDDYKAFIDAFLYGMPPHGGGRIEVERFVSRLLDLENVREAILFPRDLHHITP